MSLVEIIESIQDLIFNCEVFGQPNTGKILQLDIVSKRALIKLDNKVEKPTIIQVLNHLVNSEDEYHFEDGTELVDEVWLELK